MTHDAWCLNSTGPTRNSATIHQLLGLLFTRFGKLRTGTDNFILDTWSLPRFHSAQCVNGTRLLLHNRLLCVRYVRYALQSSKWYSFVSIDVNTTHFTLFQTRGRNRQSGHDSTPLGANIWPRLFVGEKAPHGPLLQCHFYWGQLNLHASQVRLFPRNIALPTVTRQLMKFAGCKRSTLMDYTTLITHLIFRQVLALYFAYALYHTADIGPFIYYALVAFAIIEAGNLMLLRELICDIRKSNKIE